MKRIHRQASFFGALILLLVAACSRPKAESGAPVPEEAVTEHAVALMQRAFEHRKAHRWSEAVEDMQTARQLAPNDPDVHRGARIFERLAPFLPAIRELDARLALSPDDDQLLTDRALLFLRSDDNELALADAEAAMAKADWAMRPRLLRGIALDQLERDAECEPLGIDLPLRLSALSAEFLETISRLDAQISAERENAELYVARAWQLNEISQPRLALGDAETALRLAENSGGAHLERGYALAKLGRGEEALAALRRATELDPNLSLGWQYRGELEMTMGDNAAAIESLSRALALNPTAVAQQKRDEAQRALEASP